MGQNSFEKLHVYQLAERLASEVWKLVIQWNLFARDTIGKQLVRAADSIGANIAEGCGRGSYADTKRFILVARGSLNETICWLQRTQSRQLLIEDQARLLAAITTELGPRLNGYLNFITKQHNNRAKPGQPPKA